MASLSVSGITDACSGLPARKATPMLDDYPVREYVAAMSVELARMARWDGDEALADALEAVSEQARRPRD